MSNIKSTKDSLDQRLGSGVSFPFAGNFEPVSGVDMLLQDIQSLLLTSPGSRVYRPTYGCGLQNLIWSNIDEVISQGPQEIRSAISKFEPRITVTAINSSVNRNTGLVIFSILFLINSTNTSLNLVFPFRSSSQISAA